MKTLFIAIVLVFLFNLSGCPQNRIDSWDIEKISSIQIEISYPGEEAKNATYDARPEIEKIITFLRGVDFRDVKTSHRNATDDPDTWKYKLIFKGLRDQVYLFSNHAFIGKTDFNIDSSVIDEFEKLLSGLNINTL